MHAATHPLCAAANLEGPAGELVPEGSVELLKVAQAERLVDALAVAHELGTWA